MDRETVVIQCAGSKRPEAGRMRTVDGEPVYFVDAPAEARRLEPGKYYARPDDKSGWGGTWRDRLIALNGSGEAKKPA